MTDEPTITIFADQAEVDGGVLPRFQSLGAHVKVGDLDAGSFVVAGSMAVLRLTAQSFVEGIMDGTLFHKAGKMSLNFTKTVFVVEGDIHGTRLAIAKEAIDGAVAFLVAVEGSSVINSRGFYSTAEIVYRLARQLQKETPFGPAFQRTKASTQREQALFTIESVFGIGQATAVKVLEHFGSVHAFINASPEQLTEIAGIGRKKADRIYESLRAVID